MNGPYTKKRLIEDVAAHADISKESARRVIECFEESVRKALAEGDRVNLVGFGSFSVSKRSATTGRNPRTGEKINIPAKKVVKFKPGKLLSGMIK